MEKEKMKMLIRILSIYLTCGEIKCCVGINTHSNGESIFIAKVNEILAYDKGHYRFEFEDDEGERYYVFDHNVTLLTPYLRHISKLKKYEKYINKSLPLSLAKYLLMIDKKIDFMGLIDNYWACEDKFHIYDD